MKSLHRQKGLSLIGVGLLAFLIIFFGLLTIKMSGSYFDYYKITKMIDNSLGGQSAARFSEEQFLDRLEKNMQINRIELDLKSDITLNKRKKPMLIILDYEKRVHLFSNVDVIMAFHKEYEL